MTEITPKALLEMGAESRAYGGLHRTWTEYAFPLSPPEGEYDTACDLAVKFYADGPRAWIEIAGYMSPLRGVKTLEQLRKLLAALKGE